MKSDSLLAKRTSFARAILIGHILNIFIGTLTFLTSHFIFNYSVVMAAGVTICATLIGSVLSSVFATSYVVKPVKQLDSELNVLNEKINASHSALATATGALQGMLDNLTVGIIVFNKKMEQKTINSTARKLLWRDIEQSTEDIKPPENTIEILKSARIDNKVIDLIDWLNNSKSSTVQATKRWPMASVLLADSSVVSCDILAHYNKNDSYGNELVVTIVDRTEEGQRQDKQMEFISLAAHELRGPITIIRGLIDVFQQEINQSIDEEHQQLLVRMGVSARQLSGYVDNILSVSRIDKKEFEVHPTKANWSDLLLRSLHDLAIRAKANHRNLEYKIAKNMPTVAVDATAITHVINNLVDNAIKYTPDGGKIVISCKQDGDLIETTIQDSGIGIPASVVENLFTKFYRSHRSKQMVNGTGLGLYLCKSIVEAHGGTIWVRSSEGVGSTFGFTLPTFESAAKAKDMEAKEDGIIRTGHGWIKNHALYRR